MPPDQEKPITAEITWGQYLISSPALRECILAAEAPYRQALDAVSGIGTEGVEEYIEKRAQEAGYVAARKFLEELDDTSQEELGDEVGSIKPEPDDSPEGIPKRTQHGTRFAVYTPLPANEEDRSISTSAEDTVERMATGKFVKHAPRTAAVIATSEYITSSLLFKELPDIHHPMAVNVIGLFHREGLIVRMSKFKRSIEGISKANIKPFVRTSKFDEVMRLIPAWQTATKIRTLAHRLQVSEEEAVDRLLNLASLLR